MRIALAVVSLTGCRLLGVPLPVPCETDDECRRPATCVERVCTTPSSMDDGGGPDGGGDDDGGGFACVDGDVLFDVFDDEMIDNQWSFESDLGVLVYETGSLLRIQLAPDEPDARYGYVSTTTQNVVGQRFSIEVATIPNSSAPATLYLEVVNALGDGAFGLALEQGVLFWEEFDETDERVFSDEVDFVYESMRWWRVFVTDDEVGAAASPDGLTWTEFERRPTRAWMSHADWRIEAGTWDADIAPGRAEIHQALVGDAEGADCAAEPTR